MIGNLKDLTLNSMVAMLPSTVNYNNKTIDKTFNYIFDFESNELKQNVNVPTGRVKAHWAEFVNLKVDKIYISDPQSIINSNFKQIDHNTFTGRHFSEKYSNADTGQIELPEGVEFCHDIDSIKDLRSKLNTIDSNIVDLATVVQELEERCLTVSPSNGASSASGSGQAGSGSIDPPTSQGGAFDTSNAEGPTFGSGQDNGSNGLTSNLSNSNSTYQSPTLGVSSNGASLLDTAYSDLMSNGNGAEEYSYERSLMAESKSTIKSTARFPGDYRDLISGKTYSYIDVTSKAYALIPNTSAYALNTSSIGQVINLVFADRVDGAEFKVKLDKADGLHLYVQAKDAMSTRVSLICTSIDLNYGPVWEVYSFGTFGNFTIK